MREVPSPTRGSGATVCCGGHRERCLFGHMHSWSTWYEGGKLQRTTDTFHCHVCGGVCTADEEDCPATSAPHTSTSSAIVAGTSLRASRRTAGLAGRYVNADPPPSHPPDDPIWIEHAAIALAEAHGASIALTGAILNAQRKITDLAVEWAERQSPQRTPHQKGEQ
jgi:hypothetical protein